MGLLRKGLVVMGWRRGRNDLAKVVMRFRFDSCFMN